MPGMEHWLPLYYETLETPVRLPARRAGARSTIRPRRRAATVSRRSPISIRPGTTMTARTRAAARRSTGRSRPTSSISTAREWEAALREPPGRCSCRPLPRRKSAADALRCRGRGRRRISPPSAPTRTSTLFEAVRDYLDAERKSGRRAAIAAYQRRLGRPARRPCCASAASPICARSRTAGASPNCRARRSASPILPLEQGFATDDLVLLGEQDILGDRLARTPRRRRSLDEFISRGGEPVAGRSRRPCRARHRPLRGAGDARRRRRAA